ncbi:MAG: DNA repair protein RadA [Candidatus Krumholzibacteriota bacterium]|nr:DNA repair protein RadA [Candidatus Krumholzibacteriota bacterium]
MARKSTRYLCKECGAESATWMGRCPACGAWDSLTELARVIGKDAARAAGKAPVAAGRAPAGGPARPLPLAEVPLDATRRVTSGLAELDRVLGGGFVPGAAVLVGGDPGIGKSTLLLQAAHAVAAAGGRPVLYVTGEESPGQVRLRAERLGALSPGLLLLAATDLDEVLAALEQVAPSLLILDSVQTLSDPGLEAATGSPAQVRHVAQVLTRAAKASGWPLVLIGHVTKEGQIAGPRLLEHMVDAVFYFEGEEGGSGRILRSVKNRFGPTHEVALFTMGDGGLSPVEDPSGFLGGRHLKGATGAAVTVTWKGSRPLAVEVQALVSAPRYGTPARVIQGVDPRRVGLLVAVLEKAGGLAIGGSDIFVSVAGGLRLDDPSTDAALLAALASAHAGAALPDATLYLGEAGLRGDLRAGGRLAERCLEAARLGFARVLSPAAPEGVKGLPADLVRIMPDVAALLAACGLARARGLSGGFDA